MGIRNSNVVVARSVQRHIGTAYDTVLLVSQNLDSIVAVVDYIDDINVVGTDIASVQIVAAGMDEVIAAGANIPAITLVNANATDISLVASDIGSVILVAADLTNIDLVAADLTSVNTAATDIANINILAAVSSDIVITAAISSDVTSAAAIAASITIVAGDSAEIVTLAGISADVTAVAAVSSDIPNVIADKNAFDIDYATFNSDLSTFTTTTGPGFVTAASDEADRAEAAASTISAIGAYAGEWVNLIGALSIPASVGHAGSIWLLNGDLADVTLSEPSGPNTDWNIYTAGASAYEIAVSNGFVGTEQLWLDTITGAYEEYGTGDSADDNTLNAYAKYEATQLEALADSYPDLGASDATVVVYAIHTWGSPTLPGKKVQEATGTGKWFKRFSNGSGIWQAWKEVNFDYVAPDLTPDGLGVLALDSSNTMTGSLNLTKGLIDPSGKNKPDFNMHSANVGSTDITDGDWYVVVRLTLPIWPTTWSGETIHLTTTSNSNIPQNHNSIPAIRNRYAITCQSSDNTAQVNTVEIYGTEVDNIRVRTTNNGIFEIQWKGVINRGIRFEGKYGSGVRALANAINVEYFDALDAEPDSGAGDLHVPTIGLYIEEKFGELDSTKLTYLGDKVDRSDPNTKGVGDDSTLAEAGTTIYYTGTRAEGETDGYPALGNLGTLACKWILKTEGIEGVYKLQTASTGGWTWARSAGSGDAIYGSWYSNAKEPTPSVITANSNLTQWARIYSVDVDGLELTLPLLPVAGQVVPCIIGGIKNTTFLRNGSNINGVADDLLWDISNSSPVFTYIDDTIGWRV